ncbi:hypothetical protein E2C01_062921 [Portunus trituberculatus]|uniref:Uncharacterized protein n=1 Tax=Portunus trituberculatus TaxID=210409 RepID=A0A5B7HHE1_PORTR|nr:hypothetical protein [Portunus trituberculatus]
MEARAGGGGRRGTSRKGRWPLVWFFCCDYFFGKTTRAELILIHLDASRPGGMCRPWRADGQSEARQQAVPWSMSRHRWSRRPWRCTTYPRSPPLDTRPLAALDPPGGSHPQLSVTGLPTPREPGRGRPTRSARRCQARRAERTPGTQAKSVQCVRGVPSMTTVVVAGTVTVESMKTATINFSMTTQYYQYSGDTNGSAWRRVNTSTLAGSTRRR